MELKPLNSHELANLLLSLPDAPVFSDDGFAITEAYMHDGNIYFDSRGNY